MPSSRLSSSPSQTDLASRPLGRDGLESSLPGMNKNQKGFTVFELVIIIVIVALVGAAGYYIFGRSKNSAPNSSTTGSSSTTSSNVSWSFDGETWKASGTPPACPSPLAINSPTDVSLATAILYPGQYRGQYKPHGGFRFADSTNDKISVKVPIDSQLVKGSRYIEQGETQYLLVFIAPCGLSFRFDHLYTLSDKFQQVVNDNFPPAKQDDSRTTNLNKPVAVKAGDLVALGVGFKKAGNTSFDFGVYDLRNKNEISKNSQWAFEHQDDKENAPYGICWLDIMPSADKTKVKTLPAGDSASGAISDYCETPAGTTITNTAGHPSGSR